MTSALGCVGLGIHSQEDFDDLLERIRPELEDRGTFDGVRIARWQDPSGACIQLGILDDEIEDLLPTFAGEIGGTLSDCHLIAGSVAIAGVVDEAGEQVTALAFDSEDYRRLASIHEPVSGPARMTALGVAVNVYENVEVFAT